MYFAGYIQKSDFSAKRLFFVGISIAVLSLVANLYLVYTFHREYYLHREFELEEGLRNAYALDVSEVDVSVATYNISISGEEKMNVSVEILNAHGSLLDSEGLIVDRKGNLTREVSVDGDLARLVVTIENEGWGTANVKVDLAYTKSSLIHILVSVIAAIAGISGVVITAFAAMQYMISRMEPEKAEHSTLMRVCRNL